MTGKGEPKYLTAKDATGHDVPLTVDLIMAHLLGRCTLGGGLFWADATMPMLRLALLSGDWIAANLPSKATSFA